MRRSERSGLDFAVLFSLLVSLEGVDHDVQAQNDQQDSQDQLQAVGNEHGTPSGLARRNADRSGGARLCSGNPPTKPANPVISIRNSSIGNDNVISIRSTFLLLMYFFAKPLRHRSVNLARSAQEVYFRYSFPSQARI